MICKEKRGARDIPGTMMMRDMMVSRKFTSWKTFPDKTEKVYSRKKCSFLIPRDVPLTLQNSVYPGWSNNEKGWLTEILGLMGVIAYAVYDLLWFK